MLYSQNNCLPFPPSLPAAIPGGQLPPIPTGYQYSAASEFNLPTTSFNSNSEITTIMNASAMNQDCHSPAYPVWSSPLSATSGDVFTFPFPATGEICNAINNHNDSNFLFNNKENIPSFPTTENSVKQIEHIEQQAVTVKTNLSARKLPLQSINLNCVPSESRISKIHDEKYWERRQKNNEAAKHSRSKRKDRENQLRQQVAELEAENKRLRKELNDLLRAK